MSSDPRELRAQAGALRRAADRLTLVRLRLANTIGDVARSGSEPTRRLGEDLHERWTSEVYPELGRIVSGLRSSATQLDEVATVHERSSGRRLGGYAGAGFLGRGEEAHRHVGDVAHFVGTQHGASIGGYPLAPSAPRPFLPDVSHSLGTQTPDFDEDDDRE
ncbi:hypothetical protein ACFQS2_08300 [Brachybacterium sp. GCM10030267]|uniref:hypothetical protein n=1 Tax=unclassified Brachybacterium TaxID=2623841 RepID=UPI003623AC7E